MPTPEYILSLREKIGHDLLWLPGATAVVLHEGRILLGRRADNGNWAPITGIVDPGEEPAAAAVRECLEEAGVVCEVEGLAGVKAGERSSSRTATDAGSWTTPSDAATSAAPRA